jgi:hypothetical protein
MSASETPASLPSPFAPELQDDPVLADLRLRLAEHVRAGRAVEGDRFEFTVLPGSVVGYRLRLSA